MRMLVQGVEYNSIERMAATDDQYLVQFVEDDGTPIDLTVSLTVAQILFYTASNRSGLTPAIVGLTVHPTLGAAGFATLTIGDTTAPFSTIGVAQYGYGKHTVADAVGTITMTNKGTGYSSAPGVTFTGGTPSTPATAQANLTNGVASIPITTPGQNFTTVPVVTLNNVTGAVATVTIGGCPLAATATMLTGGSGFTSTPAVAISAPTGTKALQAAAIAKLTNGIDVFTISNGGTGYISTPDVVIAAPPSGGVQATAVATVTAGVVTGIQFINRGSGYLVAPAISFTGGGGTAAAATVALTGIVLSVIVTNVGDGYLSGAYTVTISGGGGTGAAATIALGSAANSGITGITVTEPGTAAASNVTVTLTGGAGSGAVFGTPVLTGRVLSITLLNGGAGYSGVPAVGFTGGGGGVNAAATAFLDGGDVAVSTSPVVITSK